MKASYEATFVIPELGVEPGDLISVRPHHPDNPFLVTRRHPRDRLPLLLDHLDRLVLLDSSGGSRPGRETAELREIIMRGAAPAGSHLKRFQVQPPHLELI